MRKSERFASLKNEIEIATHGKIEILEREYQLKYDTEMKQFRENLEYEIQNILEKKTAELVKYKTKIISQNKVKLRQELIEYRESLVQELFKNVEDRIREYVKTSEYQNWLKNKLVLILTDKEFIGGEIVASEQDIIVLNSEIKKGLLTCDVRDFRLGGFVVHNKDNTKEFNNTFGVILDSLREWFSLNSDFTIFEVDE